MDKLIQVCYSLDAHNIKRETEGLLEAMMFFDQAEGYILTYSASDVYCIENKKINVMPAWEYFGES